MTNLRFRKNRRVLVVDDNRAIHDDLRKILAPATATEAALDAAEAAIFGPSTESLPQAPFEVDSAYQGHEGLLRVEAALKAGRPYAMAFVDVRMPPGCDGVETTRQLWELDPDLQVVLCTAFSDYSWDEIFQRLGQHDGLLILKKPFDAVEALQLAHALTDKWELHQESRRKMEDLESRVAERTRTLQQTNDALQKEIGERKQAENALRESNELFQQLADNITDAFWIRSADLSHVLYKSPAFGRIWGRSMESLYADPQPWTEFVLPEDRERVLNAFLALIRDAPGLDLEYRIMRPGGEIRWVRVRGFRVLDAANNLIRHTGIVTDITERKQVEAKLSQSQKLETVGRLAGGIAHEFNSILTAIIGQSELILGDLPPAHPLSQNAAQISEAAGRAAALTRQLLAYGRRTFLRPEPLNLNAVIAGMEAAIRHVMGIHVDVRIAAAADLGPVKADAGQIEQVVMNLVMNAADAMPNGGILTLETANVSLNSETIGRYPDLEPGDYVMLAITDTGAGMTDTVKARIFEPFFTTKGVGRGTGLGLSTAYGIIKQSGGHLSSYSEPGRGTTFRIYLSRLETVPPIPVRQLDSPALPRGTETILLVEDDPALREMAATLLGRLGYTVVTAADGIEALRVKRLGGVGHVDLLFTDVVMPHMSGNELADRLRAVFPHTRVLFTSAYTENAILHQGMLNPGVALLQKPFTPFALAQKLREVLDQPVAQAPDKPADP